jgi:ubiquinone/menaquinone biosynthesis C-methylase UbiE
LIIRAEGSAIKRRNELGHRVCPWWLGYFLASPIRRFLYDPEEVLGPYIKEGMNVLDLGCGMGFFSLPMAKMIGKRGKVVCIDLQEKMIKGLVKRAQKAGLSDRIKTRTCRQDSLGVKALAGNIDFALAFALVHEVPDKERLFSEIYDTLRHDGKFLLVEPSGHVSKKDFEETVSAAQSAGFAALSEVKVRRSHAVLLCRREDKKRRI